MFIGGVDTQHDEITDFGGQRDAQDRNSIVTGLRELCEESLGVFGEITVNDVRRSYAVYSHDMMIMFIYMDLDTALVTSTFDELRTKKLATIGVSRRNKSTIEVKQLVAMSFDEFRSNICDPNSKMYERVRVFLRRYIAGLLPSDHSNDTTLDREFFLFRSALLYRTD